MRYGFCNEYGLFFALVYRAATPGMAVIFVPYREPDDAQGNLAFRECQA